MSAEIAIRAYETSDLEAIVEFSIRAWQPVFESLREILGDSIFERLNKPNWTAVQAEAVRTSCTSGERDVFVAVAGELPVGFVAVALNAFHQRMGVVEIVAVDPDYQRRGIARQLMARSTDHMRSQGMDIAAVETGGDRGHGPARAVYESLGYTALPVVRSSGCSTEATPLRVSECLSFDRRQPTKRRLYGELEAAADRVSALELRTPCETRPPRIPRDVNSRPRHRAHRESDDVGRDAGSARTAAGLDRRSDFDALVEQW
jgi:GNAT superfamily N-acetyltransferase